jgi:NAD-dependent dihydropyrimidine dehydrogenase PreA subunit
MAKRKIIKIDEEKCNGCGLCIPNCPEGALQIIDGKARLVSDLFCDGLGACIGHCPEGAITIKEREAQKYDERKVMENIVKQGKNVIKAHLKHLKEHNQNEYLKQALAYLKEKKIEVSQEEFAHHGHKHKSASLTCPSAKIMDLRKKEAESVKVYTFVKTESQLQNWPVQIKLVPSIAPFLKDADLLIAADCVPFAYADFHKDLLKGKVLLVGCPKLDDVSDYLEKITQIIKENNIKSITYAYMEVPCCSGLVNIIKSAILQSGEDIPFREVIISIKGERLK